MEHIEIVPRTIFSIGPIPVTNTILSAWVAMAILLAISFTATRTMKLIPTGLQNLMEYVVELLLMVCESTMGRRRGRRFFPVVATAFLFILTANWVGLLPGFGDVPWLRSANSDLNVTAAMALVVLVLVQYFAIRSEGIGGYLKEFKDPFHLIAQLTRPLTLAMRLFGNILAGEIVIASISGLIAFLAPTIFFGLEVFVGILQAIIFSMLTMVYLAIATLHEHHEAQSEEASHQ